MCIVKQYYVILWFCKYLLTLFKINLHNYWFLRVITYFVIIMIMTHFCAVLQLIFRHCAFLHIDTCSCVCIWCVCVPSIGCWGWTPKVPRPGIQATHPAPAPHARHGTSTGRSRSVARPISGFVVSLRQGAASNVHCRSWCSRAGFCHMYKLILTSPRANRRANGSQCSRHDAKTMVLWKAFSSHFQKCYTQNSLQTCCNL